MGLDEQLTGVPVHVVAAARARVGTRVVRDKYSLDGLLGIGGTASVYAATHRNGSRAAIKVLHRHLLRFDDVVSRFQREGYVANRVGHPGVVRILDDDHDADGCPLLVMELVDGDTLEARCANAGGRLPVEMVATCIERVLDVLAVAHDEGIVHRDMKPGNVLVTHGGEIRVTDFGIAQVMESRRTQTGDLVGTPEFMPPEQALGRRGDIDARSDVWAVGATMFALLTGRSVREQPSIPERLIAAATEAAPSIAACMPELPREIAHVVDTALAFDRERRWPSARAMQDALWTAAHQAGLTRAATSRVVQRESPTVPAPRPSTPTLRLGSVAA